MKSVTIYGFKCVKKDEKALLQAVNTVLAAHDRTTSKAKNAGLLAAYAPLVLKHFYWNLNRSLGTWFDIYPNEDVHGAFFFPGHKECAWLMHVRIDPNRLDSRAVLDAADYVQSVLTAIPFERVTIKDSDDLLNGLSRGELIEGANPI